MNSTIGYDVTVGDVSTQLGGLVIAAGRCFPCIARYLPYKMFIYLWTYVPPILVVFGTVGNLLTLAVLRSRHHKASPINVALAALAVADIGVLILGLLNHWTRTVWEVEVRKYGQAVCKIHLTLSYYFSSLSPNLLAVTTIERCLSVCLPLHVGKLVTRRRMIVICGAVALFLFACHSPILYFANLDPARQLFYICRWDDIRFSTVYYWIQFVLQFFVPFLVILVGNCVIIGRLTVQAATQKAKFNMKDSAAASHSITRMLVVVGLTFLLTITPYNVYMLGRGHSLWHVHTDYEFALHTMLITIFYQLMYLNSAINFVLYCLGGSRFRRSLKLLFGCRGRSGEGGSKSLDMQEKTKVSVVETPTIGNRH